MPEVTLSSVMEKLDMVDGVRDGRYLDLTLSIKNSTGTCEAAEVVASQIPADFCYQMRVAMENPEGRSVSIDCGVLVERLNVLVDIAQKLPSYKFLADIAAGRSRDQLVVPTREDLFGYHIVDHIISSLLLGFGTTSQSFSELFSTIDCERYTESVETMAAIIPGMPEGSLIIDNVSAAFNLFKELGTKYGFETSQFRQPAAAQSN